MNQLKRRFQLVTGPAEQPVSLADVKSYLKVDHSDEDAVLDTLIAAATQLVESYLNLKLVSQSWKVIVSGFPEDRVFDLGIGNLQSITSVSTIDKANVTAVVPSTDYSIGVKTPHGSVIVAEATDWPTTELKAEGGIEVVALVGYGAASAVPLIIKSAIYQAIAGLYENRGDANLKLSPMALTLLSPYRVIP